ncbi:hypothetical protein ALC56_10080 [Trachymyrmex septentrionalis]|uniref:Uncharacterized protein n=1 Tax=Trachymyrmex septentrionalis TaxID=34720 RepID=A0A195F4Y7_9HYME|nr:hypothetical protein ALC56_10080 [Trachymyrmex septentrionalis]
MLLQWLAEGCMLENLIEEILERVRRRRRTCSGPLVCVSLVRIPLAIRISLQMTWPPNYPRKVPKHASRNLTEDLTVRKERERFTLG